MACVPLQAAARTIVFCNKIETCRKVENVLKRGGGGHASADGPRPLVLPHHAAIEEGARARNLKVEAVANWLLPPHLEMQLSLVFLG